VSGVGQWVLRSHNDTRAFLIGTLRRLAAELEITASSVLLAAHAKVLSSLSGERAVATGYIGRK
jgi:hypothetical protein